MSLCTKCGQKTGSETIRPGPFVLGGVGLSEDPRLTRQWRGLCPGPTHLRPIPEGKGGSGHLGYVEDAKRRAEPRTRTAGEGRPAPAAKWTCLSV